MNWAGPGTNFHETTDALADISSSPIPCSNSSLFNSVCFVVKFVSLEKSNHSVTFSLFSRRPAAESHVSNELQWDSAKVKESPVGASSQLVWCSRHCLACLLPTDTRSGVLITCGKCSFLFPVISFSLPLVHHLPSPTCPPCHTPWIPAPIQHPGVSLTSFHSQPPRIKILLPPRLAGWTESDAMAT